MRYLLFLSLFFLLLSCEDDEVITELGDLIVRINEPINLQAVSPNNSVNFQGEVIGDETIKFENLRAVWVSDIDGLLFEENLSENGTTSFTTNNLSKNVHNIKLEIFNEIDALISDEVQLFNAIKLFPIEKTNNTSIIKWCSMRVNDFNNYSLYRSRYKTNIFNDDPIYTTNNSVDTVFIDDNAIIGRKYYYKVRLHRNIDLPNEIDSNLDSIVAGKFIKVNYPLLKVISDPSRNFAYGTVNLESIYQNNSTGYGLIFIDTENEVVEKRILEYVRFSDLAIGPNNNYLYLCNRSQTIFKIDLNTRELESTFNLSHLAHKIEIGNNDRLYYHLTPPTSGSTPFNIYNLATNIDLPFWSTDPASFNNYSHGDFELDETNTIIHGESNSSGSDITKLKTTNDVFTIESQWNSHDYQSPRIILKGNKIFWNHYLFDLDLNLIGTFQKDGSDINIQDVSPNGNLSIGWRNLFESENQSIIKEIPSYYDKATFLDNNNLLLIENENPLYQEYNSTIYFYTIF